ncbi:MAG: GAF domain-containing protein [Gemmatimonadaceae bacterium]|nr:GAF domain-containing protein [Gemmatimonadaceae bacterium]
MSPSLDTHPTPASPALSDVLDALDRADSSAARVQAAADAFAAMGFERVVITLRDGSLNVTMSVTAGSADPTGVSGYALQPLPGAVWRRRLPQLERFRVGELYLLDGSDAWVAREFFAAEPSPRSDGRTWLPTDLMLGALYGAEHELLGIVKLAAPRDGRRPTESKRRDLASLVRHLAARLAYDALRGLAQRRSERLQRLQEAGAAMARSLDEHEILRELARQATRSTRAEGVMIGLPDLDQDVLATALRMVRGVERPRAVVRLGEGIIAEVARTGRPVRVGDRDADRAREKAGLAPHLSTYDVMGDSGPAASMLAVPLLAGIHLIGVLAVHAASTEIFSADDEEMLATMGSQAATAVANARRYAESERERRQTEALADVARAVGESLRLGEVLRLILRHSVSLLGVEGACVALRHDDYMHIVAAVGAADVLAGVHLPVASSLLGKAVTENELIVSNDFRNDPNSSRTVQRLAQIQRTAIAPLMTARGTIGAISVINREQPFTADDARVLQRLADHVAVAIVNARLFEEVERATREWKVAFDAIASGMVVLDDALTVRRCNARAAELCGTIIADLLGKSFGPALLGAHAAEVTLLAALVHRSLAEGVAQREIVRDESGERLYEFLVAPHPAGGCVVTFDDVTSVHRLTERHRRVLETVTDAIVITGLDGRIAFANAASNALFRTGELVGQHVAALTAPEWLDEVIVRERSAREGLQQRYECEVVCADGTRRRVAVSSAPLLEVGQVTGTVACLRDVTDQRADAEALVRSEARYERLFESASDAIFTVDPSGCFSSVNRGLLIATGMTRESLIGRPYAVVVDPRDHGIAEHLLTKTFAGERQRLQLRYVGAQGMPRVGAIITSPILERGIVVGGLGIMRDITDEELSRETNAQRERLATAGELLQGVANELNNPLTSLLALTNLGAESSTLVASDREAMTQIAAEAQRVSRILAQLLDATSENHIATESIDVNRSVRRAIELHGLARRGDDAELTTSLDDALPPVRGDARRLQQVLLNLLANAADAVADSRSPRRIHVATRRERDRVLIEVSDTGHGIAPADLSRVFRPMYTTRFERGRNGYGLSIARQLVEAHRGTLTVRSSLGDGTTFTIALPVDAESEEVTASAGLSDRATAHAPDTDSPSVQVTRHGSLLVVEDEAPLRAAISRYLRKLGYEVEAVGRGDEALMRLEQRAFDLILLDLRLPDMSGDEVYRALEARSPALAQRVLFTTGDLSRPAAAEFVVASGRPVIAKPFQLAELDLVLAGLLRET